MIVYKIDKSSNSSVNSEIRDMGAVLGEIAPTLQILSDLLARHEATISSPSIANYRAELQSMIAQVMETVKAIAENSQKLVSVSDQASKHLAAIEEHFGAALREPVNQSNAAKLAA